MIDRETAHELSNMLQTLMGQIELDRKEEAKQTVRRITDFLNVHTSAKESHESQP